MNYYKDLRNKYHTLVYQNYILEETENNISTKYTYTLGEYTFTPTVSINKKYITNKNIDKIFLDYLFFNYGLVNIINYFKLTCPNEIVVECGYLEEEQTEFFKKLIFNGLSEYFYKNNIDLTYDEFTNFKVTSNKKFNFNITDVFTGWWRKRFYCIP